MLKNSLKMGVLIAALIVGNTAFACNQADLVKKDGVLEFETADPASAPEPETSESKNG